MSRLEHATETADLGLAGAANHVEAILRHTATFLGWPASLAVYRPPTGWAGGWVVNSVFLRSAGVGPTAELLLRVPKSEMKTFEFGESAAKA